MKTLRAEAGTHLQVLNELLEIMLALGSFLSTGEPALCLRAHQFIADFRSLTS